MMDHVDPSYGARPRPVSAPRVLVIGDGIIGLAVAVELTRRGSLCRIAGARNPGAASEAAAGLLAPNLGAAQPAVRSFYRASMAAWPEFVERLRPWDPDLGLVRGLIQLGAHGDELPDGARRMKAEELRRVEPAVAADADALFFAQDGAVDNVRVMGALRTAARQLSIPITDDPVARVRRTTRQLTALTVSNESIPADKIVVAAGAWTAHVGDLPRQLPIEPIKGQMFAVDAPSALEHAVYGPGAYVVPRTHETVVGATSEQAGFDARTSRDAIDALRDAAIRLCPTLATARVSRTWAGLRPATPDMLPILGPDPDDPRIIYACGHSRNGILLAPATASVMASWVLGEKPGLEVSAFGVGRFAG